MYKFSPEPVSVETPVKTPAKASHSIGNRILLHQRTLDDDLTVEGKTYRSGQYLRFYTNGDIVSDDGVYYAGREITQRDIELWFGVKFL